ncbi:MAG: DUF86 domain-containing protein [Armatimonadota bacterium]
MIRDDSIYFKHILEAINRIGLYVYKINHKSFLENDMIQDAVIRQIEIMGEAVKNISDELKGKYPNIPWKDIAGMRDKLIHDYFGVDTDAVWDTVEQDIPVFKKEVEDILKEEGF